MNPNDLLTQMISTLGVVDNRTLMIGNGGSGGTITASTVTVPSTLTDKGSGDIATDILDKWSMNRMTVDHKVQEQELMKIRETIPTYADEIKENLAKSLARDISKKASFTKKHDKDADVHHFIGRVWVFTEDELKQLIKDVRHA